jgi:hypothetical protein
MKPLGALIVLFLFLSGTGVRAQSTKDASSSEQAGGIFRLDPRRPFVYLKFDHIGQGERHADNEPSTRVWLHLVNNCRLPIIVRGGQPIDGGAPGEISIDSVVRPNLPIFTTISIPPPQPDVPQLPNLLAEPGQAPPVSNSPQNPPATPSTSSEDDEAYMPAGYPPTDVVSIKTILPGREILFSVPVNFVSKKWHFEINFNFGPEQANEGVPEELFFTDPNVRGQVEMTLSYGLQDVPSQYQNEVEKLNQQQLKDRKTTSR